MDPISTVQNIFSLCQWIYQTSQTIKANREQANRLCQRLELVGTALKPLQNQRSALSQLTKNLEALEQLLTEIRDFMMTYQDKAKWFKRVFKSGANAEAFEDFRRRLHEMISQMNLSVSVEAFTYQQADKAAEQLDREVIESNRETILELNQLARHHFDALMQKGSDVEAMLSGGLYGLKSDIGKVRQDIKEGQANLQQAISYEHKELRRVVSALKQTLAKSDKRLLQAVQQVHGKVGGIEDGIAALHVDQRQHFDMLQLQMLSMRRQFQAGLSPASAPKKPKIDSRLIIPLYEVDIEAEPFAQGSFGEVYRGAYGEETIAIKLFPNIAPENEDQFYRGIDIMSRLRSRYVTSLYGASVTEGHAALMMAYMAGGGLDQYLQKNPNLSWEQKHQMMIEVTSGLSYLHQQGVIHRNLKSTKVLVDEHGSLQLSDFGLATAQKMSVQTIQNRSLAFSWMAPEYFSAENKLTKTSDVYSLGVVLLEIATQQAPMVVGEQGLTQTQNQARCAQMPEGLADEVKALIRACLSYEASARPAADSVVKTLKQIDITPRPPSPSGEAYYQQGVTFQQQKKYDEANKCFEQSAKKQFVKAYTNLGLFAAEGVGGCNKNPLRACQLWEQAAQGGHARAMINLANLFGYDQKNKKGEVVIKQDYKKAYGWAEQAKTCAGDKKQKQMAEGLYQKFKSRYEALASTAPNFMAFSKN